MPSGILFAFSAKAFGAPAARVTSLLEKDAVIYISGCEYSYRGNTAEGDSALRKAKKSPTANRCSVIFFNRRHDGEKQSRNALCGIGFLYREGSYQ